MSKVGQKRHLLRGIIDQDILSISLIGQVVEDAATVDIFYNKFCAMLAPPTEDGAPESDLEVVPATQNATSTPMMPQESRLTSMVLQCITPVPVRAI